MSPERSALLTAPPMADGSRAVLGALTAMLVRFLDLGPDELHDGIEDVLRGVGELTGADRVYVFRFDAAGATVTNTHEWCASDITPQIDNLQQMPVDVLSEWLPALLAGEPVHVPSVADMAHCPLRRVLEAQQIVSTLVVPMQVGRRLVGFLGLDAVRAERCWSPEEIGLLQALTAAMMSAVARCEASAQLEHQSMHDPLTGLPNRGLLVDRLHHALERLKRTSGHIAVLLIGLDRFKLVNESLGHGAGDQLLMEAADRLASAVRTADTVARLGGDEFVVVMESCIGAYDALQGAKRLVRALTAPLEIAGQELFVSASAGLVLADASSVPEDLLRDADTALRQAKEGGRGSVELFESSQRSRVVDQIAISRALHRAVERRELRLHYQPLFDLDTGCMLGAEALLRWEHPERGLVPPGEFIPVAEETGLIVPIGEWVIEEAVAQLARWRTEQPESSPIVLSVNLSVRQLANRRLTSVVREALTRHDISPDQLCLELTESALMAEPEAGLAVLNELRDLGAVIAIDDFGTGYSSLAHLRNLPVDILKIDRSFVTGLGTDSRDSRVISAIVSLAHEFGMTALAEGVETARQLAELRALGCDAVQGFYLGKPAGPEVLTGLRTVVHPRAAHFRGRRDLQDEALVDTARAGGSGA